MNVFGLYNFIDLDLDDCNIIRYMAPEVLNGEAVSAQSDVYQWGLFCLELMTGKKPFYHITEAGILKETILQGETPDIPDYICPKLRSIISACLSEPEKRPSLETLKNQQFLTVFINDYATFSDTFWIRLWDRVSEESSSTYEDMMSWEEFFPAFCNVLNIYFDTACTEYKSLKYILGSYNSGIVKKRNYLNAYCWITEPIIPGWGYIASLKQNLETIWFCGNESREDVEEALKNKYFLVRYSENTRSHVITYKQRKKPYHIRVLPSLLFKAVKNLQVLKRLKPHTKLPVIFGAHDVSDYFQFPKDHLPTLPPYYNVMQ
eukprot:TRINITY_DN3341_c0_g1_i2.p1 TRINITY_DN3341_c0_g1~~TRINITY_DN3341_c0_g1_i2.p1  ORF type:complete len:319 (-),score=56.23 TRINITY_DN3341_c0_g1_i2:38-994(-)